jgi:hypothetical protein
VANNVFHSAIATLNNQENDYLEKKLKSLPEEYVEISVVPLGSKQGLTQFNAHCSISNSAPGMKDEIEALYMGVARGDPKALEENKSKKKQNAFFFWLL